MLTKEDVARILLNTDAVVVSPADCDDSVPTQTCTPYVGCSMLASYPAERSAVVDAMVDYVGTLDASIDVIAAADTSSTFLASLVAQRLQLPMVYIRPTPKAHGMKKQVEGVLRPGQRVLVVNDVISADKDISSSVGTIVRNEGVVAHCLSVFDNRANGTRSTLTDAGVPCSALTDPATVWTVARTEHCRSDRTPARDRHGDPGRKWPEGTAAKSGQAVEGNKRRVAEVLLGIEAVTINTDKPFRYTSGILSPIYTDNRLLISYPDQWQVVVNAFVDVIVGTVGVEHFDLLAGIITSGVPHAALVSDRLAVPMVAVRAPAGGDDGTDCIQGRLAKGDRVVVIEDHVTTGKSALAAIGAIRHAGAKVDWCVAIFTYDSVKARQTFAEQGINLLTLCDLPVLMEVAVRQGYVDHAQSEMVFDWVKDPGGWASRRGML